MDTAPAYRVILSNLMQSSGKQEGVTLGQMKMWLIPQKAEHETDYNINRGYFEMLLDKALRELIEKELVVSSLSDGMEDGDAQLFSLTQKGSKYIEDLYTEESEQKQNFTY